MKIDIRKRVAGSLYGMATGDALGVPTSFLTIHQIREKYGWVDTFYDPEKGHRFHDGLKAGEFTDDTEQALGLVNSFVRYGRVVPEDIVEEIIKWATRVEGKYVSPLGPSTERALKSIKAGGDLKLAGKYGNTNGSAMRISPLGIIHGLRGSSLEEMARDAYLTSMPTHNTKVCSASAAAIAWGVAQCIRGERDLEKIVAETIRASAEGEKFGFDIPAPSVGKRIEFVYDMTQKKKDPMEILADLYDMFGGGDLAADSIPLAIGLFVLGQGDPKRVNEYCVNIGGDCDTNAAMAGAMAGAYAGVDAIPGAWIATVEEINKLDFYKIADLLLDVASRWVVAEF